MELVRLIKLKAALIVSARLAEFLNARRKFVHLASKANVEHLLKLAHVNARNVLLKLCCVKLAVNAFPSLRGAMEFKIVRMMKSVAWQQLHRTLRKLQTSLQVGWPSFQEKSFNYTQFPSSAIIKKCPDPVCPPGFRIKQKEKGRGSRMMSRFSSGSDEDEDDKPQHQYYYIKAKYQASYEAILPISTNSKQQDVNAEECFEFVCLPLVEEGSEDYVDGRVDPKKCPEPKCPRGYMIRLSLVKAANECAK